MKRVGLESLITTQRKETMTTLQLTGLTLRVRDLEKQLEFYRDLLGFNILHSEGSKTELSLEQKHFTLTLIHEPTALLRPKSTLGLYHFALLLPDRKSLAAVVKRLLEHRYPNFQGASDHGVSEAFYLADPEGNGIELYRDRPQGEWPYENGKLAMVSDALNVEELLSEAPASSPLDAKTTFGHLHLHVANLDEAETFYKGLGMEVTQGDYPGARFLAADGYHHHIGTNLWARGRTAPETSIGLLGYTIALKDTAPNEITDTLGLKVRLEPLEH
jgi:catechol 2,3-dioxygenase